MRQQINLYRDELIDRAEPLKGKQAGLILFVALVIILFLGGFGYWRGQEMESQRALLESQQQQMQSDIRTLEQQFPVRHVSPLLQQRVTRLEQESRELGQTLDFVLMREQGRNSEMLAALEGLAQRRHNGLWLSQVRLSRQGLDVELSGRAFHPELVPEYLQWLINEGVFAGMTFSHLRLARLEEYPGHVDFTISSGSAGAR